VFWIHVISQDGFDVVNKIRVVVNKISNKPKHMKRQREKKNINSLVITIIITMTTANNINIIIALIQQKRNEYEMVSDRPDDGSSKHRSCCPSP
jgi:hypothetical protein